jgi:hypothetical protein
VLKRLIPPYFPQAQALAKYSFDIHNITEEHNSMLSKGFSVNLNSYIPAYMCKYNNLLFFIAPSVTIEYTLLHSIRSLKHDRDWGLSVS